jgi:uncharacterized RmlC-like cupin family protein
MRNFQKITTWINVDPLNFLLKKNPELWDANTLRKQSDTSPHRAMQDIWVRYNDDTLPRMTGDYSAFNLPHFPVWYPCINELPMIRTICLDLMNKMGATHLGGVLITKIPPGGRIEPHIDSNWHAQFYNCKLYIPLQSNIECVNRCEDEFVVMTPGECWYFNNNVEHEVINSGKDDRITLIICMRVE